MYRVPTEADLPARLKAVLAVVYLIFNEGHTASAAQIVALYDLLLALAPSPVVALNRAVAVAETQGPEAALTLVDELDLDRYHLVHAVRADLLRRLGREAEAAHAYEAAIGSAGNAAERDFLARRRRGH